jgi:hypothetical protein
MFCTSDGVPRYCTSRTGNNVRHRSRPRGEPRSMPWCNPQAALTASRHGRRWSDSPFAVSIGVLNTPVGVTARY